MQRFILIAKLNSGEKYNFLMSQLCNSLHLANVLSKDQLVSSTKIIYTIKTPHEQWSGGLWL